MSTAIDLELAPSRQDAAPSGGPAATLWRWHGHQLDPRVNSLNLIRLGLASMVLFAHGFYLAGDGVGPHVDGENLGGWAVFGFFAVSGYLITASRWSNSLGTFLVHRVARIFPAFLVCLVVIAVFFAPIGYLRQNGTLAGYLTTGPTTPAGYIFSNLMLHINANEIAGTPAGVPFPGAWDGSIWSLYYEFQCYLIVAGLAMISWVRRSPWGVAVAWILSVGAYAGWSRVVGPLLGGNADAQVLIKLLPLFLGGALVQLLRDRLPLHWTGAAISVVAVLGAIWGLIAWECRDRTYGWLLAALRSRRPGARPRRRCPSSLANTRGHRPPYVPVGAVRTGRNWQSAFRLGLTGGFCPAPARRNDRGAVLAASPRRFGHVHQPPRGRAGRS